jgi:hypothetical protein
MRRTAAATAATAAIATTALQGTARSRITFLSRSGIAHKISVVIFNGYVAYVSSYCKLIAIVNTKFKSLLLHCKLIAIVDTQTDVEMSAF